ncbi:hypothetical protein DERP_015279 [Dermatophagoides pteronyssinus]|uniref:Uncharacterized protein n=1 Tax=Dermatophagoides pteronyssinus TaxID=6956 RepID=A0ABQ8J3U2_DERPT|nr:hypothetical protein DERP_015279 [Dermatophagoides pteronyssinus]
MDDQRLITSSNQDDQEQQQQKLDHSNNNSDMMLMVIQNDDDDDNKSNNNQQQQQQQLSFLNNPQQRRPNLVHSVSIIVEPAVNFSDLDDDTTTTTTTSNTDDSFNDDELRISPSLRISERRKTIAGPVSMFEDFYFDQPKKAKEYDDVVQSLITSARLRKEEFARLLEEHDQIVKEIRKAETNLI